jgi:Ca-activated chloride channel family protein
MKNIKYLLWLFLLSPACASAWQWIDLWQTRDQQGSQLLQAGKAQEAAKVFHDKNWQSVAHYRSGNYAQAFKQFNNEKTSDGQYNAGNAAAFMENYQEAIVAYDKAVTLNPNNQDAITNREIVKKLLAQKPPQQQQQQQQQQQNNSNSNNNKQDESKSSAENNAQQQKSEQKNPTDKQDQQANNTKQNQSANPLQNSAADPKENNAHAATSNKQQRQDENNQQLLRRLSDDAGGLLQQKFLRDYARRHGADDNLD